MPFARCVLGMLASCHERGIIYRDVKPQNFLYTRQGEDGELKCSDFGLAMTFIVGEDTRVKKRAGTPVYMAPELVLRRWGTAAPAGRLFFSQPRPALTFYRAFNKKYIGTTSARTCGPLAC